MKSRAPWVWLLVQLCTLTGCAMALRPEQAYVPGTQRADVLDTIADKPLAAETRPESGWNADNPGTYGIAPTVSAFERSSGSAVQRCDVYWISRGFLGLGVYWDYVFYDKDNRVAGHCRRLID